MVHAIAVMTSLSNCWTVSVGVAVSTSAAIVVVGVCADGILVHRSSCGGDCK